MFASAICGNLRNLRITSTSLRELFPTRIPDLFTPVHTIPWGFVRQRIRERPYPERRRFFLYKAFKLDKNPRHLRHRCSNPGKQFIRIFGRSGILFIPLFPGEQVNNGREENCSFFENFSSQFSEKMFKRGNFNKKRNYHAARIKRFAFVTRFPVGKWPSVRFAIQRTNKNSKLVAVSR